MASIQKIFKAARRGNVKAQFNLAEMYEAGLDVPQDYTEAVKWYRMVAEQDNAKAQFHLGAMYQEGRGVEADYVLAHMWFNLSGSQRFEYASEARDGLASRMTPDQVAAAQKLAREWKPK